MVMAKTKVGFALYIALLASFANDSVLAASIETLVMPGPVASAHADVENNCDACHQRFDRQSQKKLCLDCHEVIASEVEGGEGFHGRSPIVQASECRQCHSDHRGRDADIVGFSSGSFDHGLTDFPLSGEHVDLACASCHEADAPHREAPQACVECHASDDVHDGALGTRCADCHGSQSWVDTAFDHDERTTFALTGAHGETSCVACHANQTFEGTSTDCVSCHRADDVHGGGRGGQCQACHTTGNWAETSFDHHLETGFSLQGAHADIACKSCHLDNMALERPPTDCAGCHSGNDVHLGNNGTDCASCHSQTGWQTSFDHNETTGFALLGAHMDLACTQCHQGALTDPLETNCFACHFDDNPHGDDLVRCETCHGVEAWGAQVQFHHDLTGFPLLGGHRVAACEQCHNGLRFSQAGGLACVDCHRNRDVHEGSMGTTCSSCHTAVAWELWRFDHDVETDFSLDGKHAGLACASCHDPGAAETPSRNCAACHAADDAHQGGFGDNCARCHSAENFSQPSIGRGG